MWNCLLPVSLKSPLGRFGFAWRPFSGLPIHCFAPICWQVQAEPRDSNIPCSMWTQHILFSPFPERLHWSRGTTTINTTKSLCERRRRRRRRGHRRCWRKFKGGGTGLLLSEVSRRKKKSARRRSGSSLRDFPHFSKEKKSSDWGVSPGLSFPHGNLRGRRGSMRIICLLWGSKPSTEVEQHVKEQDKGWVVLQERARE